jgi:triosephosphate isomerase
VAKKYIIANWKMNPQSIAEAEEILAHIDEHWNTDKATETSLVVCPPFVFLEDIGHMLKTSHLGDRVELGSQDIALADSGAWTGEISGPMLRRLDVRYVIIGHSERRWPGMSSAVGESNEIVNAKIKQALKNELVPIVCVGEKEQNGDYLKWLKQQVGATFAGLSGDEISKCLVAYEPVWAISTNPDAKADTPESALKSVAAIRDFLENNHAPIDVRILYGGSVNAENAKDFLALDELAGVLVGGASIRKEEFVSILKSA